MKIYDTSGKIIDGTPDYEAGRLLLYEDRMTYVTWDECPQGTGIGAECGEREPGEPSQIELMQAQLDYTAIMTDTLLEMEA